MSEEKLQNEFMQFYEAFKQYKSQEQQQQPVLLFDINSFAQGVSNRTLEVSARKYSKEQIRRFLSNPEQYERQLREVSVYLYNSSQEYKNLINYFSKMLTHDYIVVPDGIDVDKFGSKEVLNSFYKMLNFIENYNIKSKLSAIETTLLREDIYFGYERTDGENFIWQQLPSNHCRLLGVDASECITFEFNFAYFDKANVNIENYDPEFKTLYKRYQKDTKNYKWQKLNPEKAICFKLDKSLLHALPYFSGIFDEMLGLETYKDLFEKSTKANNYKLLHQQIPMRDDKDAKMNQFLIDDKYAKAFHNNVRSNVEGNNIGVVTTPMKIVPINLNENKIEEDLISKSQRNIFTSSGVSSLLFAGEKSSIGLNRSIENDSSIMFSLLRQYEVWFKKRLKLFNKSKKYRWKLIFPDITIFNRETMFTTLLQSAQFGFSKFFVSASLGLSQSELLSLTNLENKQLDLTQNLIPLQSSHTSAGDQGGRPELDEGDLSDGGQIQRDLDSNNDGS